MSTCTGCGHGMRMHFTNVLGEIICTVVTARYSHSGIVGPMSPNHCDCVDYKSIQTERRRTREAEEQKRRDTAIDVLATHAAALFKKP